MKKRNAPGREAEGVVRKLGGYGGANNIDTVPAQSLEAEAAFAAHAALLVRQRDQPRLRANPFWTMTVLDTRERFFVAWEGL